MLEVSGRKATIVISSGVDTFSQANYSQVLEAAQESRTPIYTIGLAHLLQQESAVYGPTAPFARIDWNAAEKQLEALAKVSGGRAYLLESDVGSRDLRRHHGKSPPAVRCSLCVVESRDNRPPRKTRVELIDPRSGEALKIHDSNGKPITARVFVEETYPPNATSGGSGGC